MFTFISIQVCIYILATEFDITVHRRIKEYVSKLCTDIVGVYIEPELEIPSPERDMPTSCVASTSLVLC